MLAFMTRFLHTADWQLGLKLNYLPGEAGARARAQRFETVRRIAAVAREQGVECVVVAGDVFDDNAVGEETLQQARDALEQFRPLPVLLLPGNHDAATPDSALARLQAGDHVRVLLDDAPVRIGGADFHPCPLRRRHEYEDPTRGLPPRTEEGTVRVAIAHGGVLDFAEETETPNLIDGRRVLERGFDYLALGDWHGTLRFGPRIWYPGTPEATRFKERDPGNVLVVEIPAPGAEPLVTPVAVARTRWLRQRWAFHDSADLDRLEDWFERLEERSWTLVELTLEGELSLADRSRLDGLLEAQSGRLLHLRPDLAGITESPSEADLAALAAEGFPGAAAAALRGQETPAARDALRLLYRFLVEEGNGASARG